MAIFMFYSVKWLSVKWLRANGIRSNSIRANLRMPNLGHLGFHLTPKGFLPGTDKLKAVRDLDAPQYLTQIRQFLGLCNYFCAHVKNFATVASALTRLTSKKAGWTGGQLPAGALNAFHKLKSILMSEPVVAYPRLNVTFHHIVLLKRRYGHHLGADE